MADKEKELIQKIASLPQEAQQRLLDKADGVCIALSMLGADKKKGGAADER